MIALSPLAGALLSAAFAPFSLLFLAFIIPSAIFYLFCRYRPAPSQCFFHGLLFGVGYFSAGVSWVYNSLHDYGGASPAFAAAATLAFIASLSLFFALAAVALGFFVRRLKLSFLCCLVYPSLWTLSEWLRGGGAGFPWNLLGQAFVDSDLFSAFFPWLGVYGVSWIVVFLCALPVLLLKGSQAQRAVGALALALVLSLPALLNRMPLSQAFGEPIDVALVQANVAQGIKFDRRKRELIVERYWRMTQRALGVDLLVWPETAIPVFYDMHEDELLDLQKKVKEAGGHFLAGFFTRDRRGRHYNSLVLLDERPVYYHKRQLVPFGEYLPGRRWLDYLNRFVAIPMSDLSAGERPGRLRIGSHWAAVSICYEAAFGALFSAEASRSDYLVNVSNDSWFGDSLAPHQHLQIARARAAESGRMMIRGTSTGISAIIDYNGKIISQLDIHEEATLLGSIRARKGETFYSKWRDRPVLLVSFFMLLLGLPYRQNVF